MKELERFLAELSENNALQMKRFKEKQGESWKGWDFGGKFTPRMFQSAASKLLKLADGESENPAKDCADVCNYAIFFKVIQESST